MAHVSRIFRSGNQGMAGMLVKARWESTSAAPKATESPADATEPIPVRYPYFVSRVGLGGMSLPVYTDIRHGGSQWITQIRKVEGDANALCRDLFDEFGWGDPFDPANTYARMLMRISKHAGPKTIFLRTNVAREIKSWLEYRGF
ncbi:hypothetical protein MEQU1_000482 [Malassezia equina]|uniref:Large ribosomal subunit protein mL49 n=1 Tax=Malassezia equina TaxID=1381935 RepID=A0AAF0EFP4_9BASI|nr:hypothetical protein MEQU1_000482 [Malassezia equina]